MTIHENYARYKYHFELLSDRNLKPNERLSILRQNLKQIGSFLCGFVDLFEHFSGNETQSLPEVILRLQELCLSVRELHEQILFDVSNLGDKATHILEKISEYQYLVVDAFTIANNLREANLPLPKDLTPGEVWFDSIQNAALFLEASMDILVNLNPPEIPEDVVAAHDLLVTLRQGGVGNPNLFFLTLDAAKHPLAVIRHDAAVLLRHYPDERSIDTLIELLSDDNEVVVAWAANSIGYLKNGAAIPALVLCLSREFEDKAYIGWVAEAISQVPDESALDKLIELLDKYMLEAPKDWQITTLPIAGIRKAIAEIGGEKAEATLKKYFGDLRK